MKNFFTFFAISLIFTNALISHYDCQDYCYGDLECFEYFCEYEDFHDI